VKSGGGGGQLELLPQNTQPWAAPEDTAGVVIIDAPRTSTHAANLNRTAPTTQPYPGGDGFKALKAAPSLMALGNRIDEIMFRDLEASAPGTVGDLVI
jgi:hypothetical protein